MYGRNNITIHQKIKYDLRYVDHIGFREDLKVVFLTLVAVISKEGQEMGKSGIHEELSVLKSQLNMKPGGDTIFYAELPVQKKFINRLARKGEHDG